MSLLNQYVEEVSWENVRKEVGQVNAILSNLIDQLEPSPSLKLFRVRYPFGSYVFNENKIHLPIYQNNLVSSFDSDSHKKIHLELSDSFLPLALLMNKKLEVFIETSGKVLPLNLIHAGEIFGVSDFFDNQSDKQMIRVNKKITAGSRNIFLLPQISNEQAHRRLKVLYRLKQAVPKKLTEHWYIFREISQNIMMKDHWCCEILFFSRRFISSIRGHKNYLALENYLMAILYEKTRGLRHRLHVNSNWEVLLNEVEFGNIKNIPNGIEISRRLLDVGSGLLPGFRPAIDETALPLQMIQNIYLNGYGLKEYVPIIMEPHYLRESQTLNRPIYVSLSLPYYTDKMRSKQSVLHELREMIYSNENLRRLAAMRRDIDFQGIHDLRYEYFYSEADTQSGIYATSEILKFDNSMRDQVNLYSNRKFPDKSVFLRGSILISRD